MRENGFFRKLQMQISQNFKFGLGSLWFSGQNFPRKAHSNMKAASLSVQI